VNDATFDVSSAISAGNIDVTNAIAFYGGNVTNNLPPNGVLKFRIDVPADGSRLKFSSMHAGSVQLYLDQGSYPTLTAFDHWRSGGGANSTLNQYLLSPNGWPWLPAYSYFLVVTNTSGTTQPFYFAVDGKNCSTDDDDNDGLPDCWEYQYFNSTFFNGGHDPDNDLVNNAAEYAEGTNPNDANSYRARLTINSVGGTVTLNPLQASYALGSSVTLTAAPSSGYSFIGWSGNASGTNNPLLVVMNSHKAINANFGPDLNLPNADYRFQNTLASSIGTPPDLQNIGAGNAFLTDTVDASARTVYRWPQGNGLLLTPTTGVIPSNVWSVVLLFSYDDVSSYKRVLDLKTPPGEEGLYILSGSLDFYPYPAEPGGAVVASNYMQMVLTRDESSQIKGYVNGVLQFAVSDTGNYGVISGPTNRLRFFIDNGAENSAGSVAGIRLYDKVLAPLQIAGLDRLPGGLTQPIILSNPGTDSSGRFYFTITGPAASSYLVEGTTNLAAPNWIVLSNIVNFPGTLNFTSPPPPPPQQLFRVRKPSWEQAAPSQRGLREFAEKGK